MAFVFRNQRSCYNTSSTPGPGQYQQSIVRQQKQHNAPFNLTSPRKIWQESNIPGPGSYSIGTSTEQVKTFVQNCGHDFALYQAPMETSIFKSSSKRFKDMDDKCPGPGQYKTDLQKAPRQRKINLTSSLQKYLQASTKIRRKEEGLGMLLQKKQQRLNKKKCVQPPKEWVVFCSQVERSKKVRPQTSIGPGSYEIAKTKQIQQRKRKPSCQSIIKVKTNIGSQEVIPLKQECIFTQQTRETITKKSFNQRKEDFFGSTVTRFKRLQKNDLPGPGNYELPDKQSYSHKPLKKKLAFGRSSVSNKQMRTLFVSPFYCQTTNKGQQHLGHVNKLLNKSFGSKQPRFKQLNKNQLCLQTSFSNQKLELYLGKQREKTNTKIKKMIYKSPNPRIISKSKSSSTLKDNKVDPRPLCYGQQVNTIAGKIKQKIQINAPFQTYACRFTENQYEKAANQGINTNKQHDPIESFQKTGNNKPCIVIMTSTNPRFVYKQRTQHLSPCTYDPCLPAKKQFNKLFI